MKNRLHNPCPTCVEYDFCQAYWVCDSRIRYLQKRRQIRAHMEEIMEKAKRECVTRTIRMLRNFMRGHE